MKYNTGKNLITDQDITVTGGNSLGNNLSDILQEQQDTLEQLKKNVKWLYKYGGVGGSGCGVGGGSSSTWGLSATLAGAKITEGGSISLDGPGSYVLSIMIQRAEGEYSVRYSYGNASAKIIPLSVNNMWRADIPIDLETNGRISIEAMGGGETNTLSCSYVVVPFQFEEIKFLKSDNTAWAGDIYIAEAKSQGLFLSASYNIAVTAETKYVLKFQNEVVLSGDITDKNNSIIYQIPLELLQDENAGLYTAQLEISITPLGQLGKTISKTAQLNLIPAGLYLKLETPVGLIYNSSSGIENPWAFPTNRDIALNFRVYKGATAEQKGEFKIYIDNSSIAARSISITDGIVYSTSVSVSSPGWHSLRFLYSLSGSAGEITKYIYTEELSTNLNWHLRSPMDICWYRFNDFSDDNYLEAIPRNNSKAYLVRNANDEGDLVSSLKITTGDTGKLGYDTMINVGIQYSLVNNTTDPIMTFYQANGSAFDAAITIYQNKVLIAVGAATYTVPIYIAKEENYDSADVRKYHLLTITSRYVRSDSTNSHRELCVYLDGVLEGSVADWVISSRTMAQLALHKGNYSVNLIEQDHFIIPGEGIEAINDADVSLYYYTYVVKSVNTSEVLKEFANRVDILGSLFSGETALYSLENDLLKFNNSAQVNGISKLSGVPSMMVTLPYILSNYNDSTTIFDWINTEYDTESDNSSDEKPEGSSDILELDYPCIVNYCPGGGSVIDSQVNIPNELGANTKFHLKLQGSSTTRYKAKNFTLSLKTTDTDFGTPLYSPNFNQLDTKTFLPENEFTLKADAVDSSHSNNVAIGKFVNDWCKFDYNTGLSGSSLNGHVKKCLEGFPFLMFLCVEGKDANGASKNDYYYLGIYNFNLGRGSWYNLGYSDISIFEGKSAGGFGGILSSTGSNFPLVWLHL